MATSLRKFFLRALSLVSAIYTCKLVLERVGMFSDRYVEFERQRLLNERAARNCPVVFDDPLTAENCARYRWRANESSLLSALMVVVQNTYTCGNESCIELLLHLLERFLVIFLGSWTFVALATAICVVMAVSFVKPLDTFGTVNWRTIARRRQQHPFSSSSSNRVQELATFD